MKKAVAIVAGAVLVISAVILVRRYEARRAHIRLAHEASAVMWNGFVRQFKDGVPLGTRRADVKKYLESQKWGYLDGRDIMVKLGEEPGDGFACDRWTVYAEFEFTHAQPGVESSPPDALSSISWKRIGHCL